MTEIVSIKQFAAELGVDRSNASKIVRTVAPKLGIFPVQRVTEDSASQRATTLTRDEADAIIRYRSDLGFCASAQSGDVSGKSDVGEFYAIQLVPDLKENRLKFGYSDKAMTRLSQHRTAAPTAVIVKVWPCKKTWELPAIDCVTAHGAIRVGAEAFDVDSPEDCIKRLDSFFALLPHPSFSVPFPVSATELDDEDEIAA